MGRAHFEKSGCAMYTLETHLRYVAEVRTPNTLSIETAILGVDAKRLHIGHTMWSGTRECATFECMLLHYDTRVESTAAFPEDIHKALSDAIQTPAPEWVGRALRRLD
ncbi:thioesterase family protein [Phycobium rhodophyticola]